MTQRRPTIRRPVQHDAQVVFDPDALPCLERGFEKLAALLAATLGPGVGGVLSSANGGSPEVLSDSGIIARRVVELPARGEDAGAMLLRNMVWTMHERYGDGAATAAVLARSMLRAAGRQVAMGANAMLLRRGIERGVAHASRAIASQAVPARGQAKLTQLARSVTGDAALGAVLGEMFDVLGADAAVLVEEFAAPHFDREYLDGGRWRARPAARALMPEGRPELALQDALVMVVDETLSTLGHVRRALELAARAPGSPPLLLVARGVEGEAQRTLTLNHARGALTIGAAIVTTADPALHDDLGDIALLCGAELMASVVGRPPERMHPACFGRARRVTLTREYLTVVGGGGSRAAAQQRIDELRARIGQQPRSSREWERLRLRVARLAGGVGIVKIGAYTKSEREQYKEATKKAIRVLDVALHGGLVPGGGVALLDAQPALAAARAACEDADELRGVEIVAAALAGPFLQIVENGARLHPPLARAEVARLGPGFGVDVTSGDVVRMADAGLLDAASVVCGALEAAGSAASMAITTGALVLRSSRRRALSTKP